MYFLFLLLLLILVLIYKAAQQSGRLMRYGSFDHNRTLFVNGRRYYIEAVSFRSYQDGLYYFNKIVEDANSFGKVLENRHDLYDWSYVLLRLEDGVIELRHFRTLQKVYLIKSASAMSFEEYYQDDVIQYCLNENLSLRAKIRQSIFG